MSTFKFETKVSNYKSNTTYTNYFTTFLQTTDMANSY